MAGSFFQHRLHALRNAAFAHVDRHADQFITCWTSHVKDEPKLGSPIIHVAFEVSEEPVECGSLPDVLRGSGCRRTTQEDGRGPQWGCHR